MKLTLISLLAVVLAIPIPSVVGDVTKAAFPSFILSVDTAVSKSIDDISLSFEHDINDWMHEKLSWVPTFILTRLEPFIGNQVVSKVRSLVASNVKDKLSPRVDALMQELKGRLGQLDKGVDEASAGVNEKIRVIFGVDKH